MRKRILIQVGGRFARPAFLAALALPLLLVAPAPAEDWPQWRGPNRDGVWSGKGIRENFPSGSLKVAWRASAGPGWSSPVVAKGRVYLTDVQRARPKATERALCFEEAGGKLLWTHEYAVEYPDWAFDPGAGGPRAGRSSSSSGPRRR